MAGLKTTLQKYSVLNFGKHKTKTVADVLVEDPGWIIWASENVDWVQFTDEVLEEAEENNDAGK